MFLRLDWGVSGDWDPVGCFLLWILAWRTWIWSLLDKHHVHELFFCHQWFAPVPWPKCCLIYAHIYDAYDRWEKETAHWKPVIVLLKSISLFSFLFFLPNETLHSLLLKLSLRFERALMLDHNQREIEEEVWRKG